ncbi:pentapeptide repeat-containing protein, partial [Fontibacillus panacisegetis]|uniref:pentapeptide repeat-containing protein n=1 Tax=Fontibacillus solani TaxID=1572857 RepID=UPI0015F8A9DF
SGHYNSGDYNSGDYNSGDYNSGDRNSGHYNSGDYNSGHYNSGDYNSGDYNSGDYNSGDRNSGHYNSGHYNSGHYNSCNYSSGSFCSVEPEFLLFNKPSPISRNEFRCSEAAYICRRLLVTDDEGKQIDYKQAWSTLWDSLSNSEKITVQSIPNFDANVFKEITGIQV